jgi:anti-sigma factor RsiW
VAQEKQHLTTEQLSTYLDEQLSAAERGGADEHLATCKQCQQVLTELRETVVLLHALPQPALPRSFVLPSETSIADKSAAGSEAAYRRRPAYIWTMLRAISALAAVFGLVMLLSGLLTPTVQLSTSVTPAMNVGEVSPQASPPSPPVLPFFDLHTPTGQLSFGFLLLLLGIIGLITFRSRQNVRRE